MEYWIKSNTGDYIVEDRLGNYYLNIIDRKYTINDKEFIVERERIEISEVEFKNLKGFIPIKEKKLWVRERSRYRGDHKYKSSGKGLLITKVLTKAEIREEKINSILN